MADLQEHIERGTSAAESLAVVAVHTEATRQWLAEFEATTAEYLGTDSTVFATAHTASEAFEELAAGVKALVDRHEEALMLLVAMR
jgi:hypothetical protein